MDAANIPQDHRAPHLQQRWLAIKNGGAEAIPPRAVMEIYDIEYPDGVGAGDGPRAVFVVGKARRDNPCAYLVNGPCEVEVDGTGKVGTLDYPLMVRCLGTGTGPYGIKEGYWYLTNEADCYFRWYGIGGLVDSESQGTSFAWFVPNNNWTRFGLAELSGQLCPSDIAGDIEMAELVSGCDGTAATQANNPYSLAGGDGDVVFMFMDETLDDCETPWSIIQVNHCGGEIVKDIRFNGASCAIEYKLIEQASIMSCEGCEPSWTTAIQLYTCDIVETIRAVEVDSSGVGADTCAIQIGTRETCTFTECSGTPTYSNAISLTQQVVVTDVYQSGNILGDVCTMFAICITDCTTGVTLIETTECATSGSGSA